MSIPKFGLKSEELEALLALQATGSGAEFIRARVVLLTAEGWLSGKIASALGVARGSVRNLLTRFRKGGVDGLKTVERLGREAKIANSAMPIAEQILSERPIKAWSVPRLCEEILARGGPEISVRWMQETLKKRTSRPGGRGTRSRTAKTMTRLTASASS